MKLDPEEAPTLDLASVDTVLTTARSVRRRLDFARPVEPEVILESIDVATQAPTGLGGESWRFLVVTDDARKRSIADLYRSVLLELVEARAVPLKPTQQSLIDRLHEIPVMILVCTTAEQPPTESIAGHVAFYGSILPAAWSLMLALRARGLGTTWTSLLSARQAEMADILDIPPEVVQTIMFPIAYTKNARLKRAERLKARHVTFWDKWGQQR